MSSGWSHGDWVVVLDGMLEAARLAGAEQAEVLITAEEREVWRAEAGRGRGTPAVHRSESQRAQAELHVYLGGGKAARVTAPLPSAAAAADRAGALAARAVAAAQDATADPAVQPPKRYDLQTRGLSIDDPRHDRLEDEDREDILGWNWGTARAGGSKVRPVEFCITEGRTVRAYGAPRAVRAVEASTLYRVDGEIGSSARGDERRVTGQVQSRHFSDIASRPLGAELARRLEAGERATRMPADPLPLVLEAHVMAELLPLLPPAFDAARLERGESFLRDRVGTLGAPNWLHITDDATVPSGLRTRAFDDRGVPPIPVPLVREGVFTGIYLDPEQARRRDTRPTGHSRGDGSLWPGNLILRPGTRTRNMVFAELNRYLVAVDLIEPPTLDPVTGRLDLKVWLVLDGADRGAGKLGAYRIQTDIFAFLGSLSQLASDETRYGPTVSCTTVTEGLPLEEM